MATRKTSTQAQANFTSGVGRGPQKYIDGVSNPNVDWAGAATSPAATQRRDIGLQQAISAGSINEGILNAGNQKWQQNAKAKGGTNWQPQAMAAATKYGASMATVEAGYGAADAAMNQAGDSGTHAGRMARMVAWDTTLHNQARARKGLPPE